MVALPQVKASKSMVSIGPLTAPVKTWPDGSVSCLIPGLGRFTAPTVAGLREAIVAALKDAQADYAARSLSLRALGERIHAIEKEKRTPSMEDTLTWLALLLLILKAAKPQNEAPSRKPRAKV